MERLKKEVFVGTDLEVDVEYLSKENPVLIDQLELFLKGAKDAGATHVRLNGYACEWEVESVIVSPLRYEIESDEDFEKRKEESTKEAKHRAVREMQSDYNIFRALKDKYGW